jgi:hypothetical protein
VQRVELPVRWPTRGVVQHHRSRATHPEEFKADMATLSDLLREGAIHPVVVDRLPIAAARGVLSELMPAVAAGRSCYYPGPSRNETLAF